MYFFKKGAESGYNVVSSHTHTDQRPEPGMAISACYIGSAALGKVCALLRLDRERVCASTAAAIVLTGD